MHRPSTAETPPPTAPAPPPARAGGADLRDKRSVGGCDTARAQSRIGGGGQAGDVERVLDRPGDAAERPLARRSGGPPEYGDPALWTHEPEFGQASKTPLTRPQLAAVALLVSVAHYAALRRVRRAQLTLLGGGKSDLVDFAEVHCGRHVCGQNVVLCSVICVGHCGEELVQVQRG